MVLLHIQFPALLKFYVCIYVCYEKSKLMLLTANYMYLDFLDFFSPDSSFQPRVLYNTASFRLL